MLRSFYLEEDDSTFIYGGLQFKAEYDDVNNKYLEPYIRKDSGKTIKYFRSKNIFVTYDNKNKIERIVFTMTCWSDDYRDYAVYNNKGIYYYECYHGYIEKKRVECDVDFSKLIAEIGL